MPDPVALERNQQVTEGPQGERREGPEVYYVLYDDGSIRYFRPEDPNVGGTGEWHELAPPDEYAQED